MKTALEITWTIDPVSLEKFKHLMRAMPQFPPRPANERPLVSRNKREGWYFYRIHGVNARTKTRAASLRAWRAER